MSDKTALGHVAAFSKVSDFGEDASNAPSAGDPPSHTAARGYYAVETAILRRGLHAAARGRGRVEPAAPAPGPGTLSVTARSLAAFLGVKDASGDASPTRLIAALDDELWFLGASPAWIGSGLLVPLGADADEATALTEGVPLASRADLALAWSPDGGLDEDDDSDGRADLDDAVLEAAQVGLAGAFDGLSIIDPARAWAWRAMIRSTARRYESAGDDERRRLARLTDARTNADIDRVVYGTLASLTVLVDFAENGQEILIARGVAPGGAPAAEAGPGAAWSESDGIP